MTRKKRRQLTKRVLALCVAMILMLTSACYNLPQVHAEKSDLTGLNAWELTKQIKIGWNLGNSLDSVSNQADPNPKQSATAWGNPEPCEELIDRVKTTGFNGIRIPVTWFEHLTYDTDKDEYVIDDDWMDYVQQVVDWAYERDMFIILNLHHEDWVNAKIWSDETYADSSKKIHDIWSQIAERFKDYDQHLIFEAMNEPRQTGNPNVSEWGGGDSDSWDYINKLNQIFVEVVRGTSSQNNERLLMLPTYDATCSITPLRALEVPEDSGNVALSVHAYVPYAFAMKVDEKHIYEPGERDEWGNDIVATLSSTMNDLHTISEEKNVPIIIGEFGASDFGNQDERVKWAEDFLTQTTEYGFPCFIWDNNVVHYDGDELTGEKYGCINRSNNLLYPNNAKVLEKMMQVVGVKDAEFEVAGQDAFWDSFQIDSDWITLKKLPNGEKIEEYNGSTLTSNFEYLNKDYRLAVVYEGTKLPKLICVEHIGEDWNWLDGVVAAEDSTKNIAYFDYEDIEEVLKGHNLSDIANLTAQAQGEPTTIYGLFAVPVNSESRNPSEGTQEEDPSEGTTEPQKPSEGTTEEELSEGTTEPQKPSGGTTQAQDPSEETTENQNTTEENKPENPTEGNKPGTTTEGNKPENPSEGNEPESPSEGNKPGTTTEENKPESPSEGSEPENPSEGNEPENPSEGSEPENPSEGNEPENPSEGSEPESPSEGNEPESPSEGNKPGTTTEGNKSETTTEGNKPGTTTEGNKPENPSEGNKPGTTTEGYKPGNSSAENTANSTQNAAQNTETNQNQNTTLTTPQITLLKLDKSNITLTVKKTYSLKNIMDFSGITNTTVEYKSFKKSVATVRENGVIKAVAPGKATIVIQLGNNMMAKVTVKVIPAKVSRVTVKSNSKGQIKLTWKKQSGISQYQVSYYDPKKGSYTKPKTVSKTSYTINNCKKNTTYKCKVRAIKKKDGSTYYGSYSKVMKVKAK